MIFGENWSFVQNPKAASSAITDALLPFVRPLKARENRGWSKHDFPTPGRVPVREYRIGVVRNPFDRMVSAWAYAQDRLPEYKGVSFRDFVLEGGWHIGRAPYLIDFCQTPQIAWLATCNRVLRYEFLRQDFAAVTEELFGCAVSLERTNASPRSGGYAAYYDPETIACVKKRFHRDLRAFGFGFWASDYGL